MSKTLRLHYDGGDGRTLCGRERGLMVTTEVGLVTCERCKARPEFESLRQSARRAHWEGDDLAYPYSFFPRRLCSGRENDTPCLPGNRVPLPLMLGVREPAVV